MVTYYLACPISSTQLLLHWLSKQWSLHSCLPFLCLVLRTYSLLSPSLTPRVYFPPSGTHLHYFSHPSVSSPTCFYKQNPSVIFMHFTHATPSLALPLNTIPSWLLSHRCHPTHRWAEHRSSSSRQICLYFCLSLPREKIEVPPRNSLPLGGKKKKASDTSKPRYRHQAAALPKPPHTLNSQLLFPLKWKAAWHLTSFLAFPTASRLHPYFHTSSFPASAPQAYQ